MPANKGFPDIDHFSLLFSLRLQCQETLVLLLAVWK